jgi:type IV secretion system protein TrbG
MTHKGYSWLAVVLLFTGVAGASEDTDSTTAAAPSAVTALPSAAGDPTAPPSDALVLPRASTSEVSPDPALSSEGMRLRPVELPAAVPPADDCSNADCQAPGEKSAPAAAKKSLPVPIGPPAVRALTESHNWAEDPNAMPTRDTQGRVIFIYSESAPTIVCAPLHVCDIELQEGETVQGAPHVGDSVRWRISPAVSGADDKKVTHLIVKPTEAGLDTNLIIPTDRHIYHIRLVSSSSRYVSSVGFYYPDEDPQSWTELSKATRRSGDGSEGMPVVAVNRLNFNYRIKVVKGKPTFKPLRAMDDGYHTYIAMNEDLPQREAPVLIGISSKGEEQMINYRLKGNLYVLDGTVFKMAFVSGVGSDQQRIELTRDPCKTRGWLGICWDPGE